MVQSVKPWSFVWTNFEMKKTNIILIFLLFCSQLWAQLVVITPAEFEKNEGLLMVWSDDPSQDSILAQLADIVQESAHLWLICEASTQDTVQIRQFLSNMGIAETNSSFIPAQTETSWVRDYGPWINYGVFSQQPERYIADARFGNDNLPLNDSIPSVLAHVWGWEYDSIALSLSGNLIQFDGLMRAFLSSMVLEQNPELSAQEVTNHIKQTFNVDEVVFLEPLRNLGGGNQQGLDQFMCLLDYQTILVSAIPDSLADYSVLEANVDLLTQLQTRFGNPYRIIRVQAPPNADGTFGNASDDEMRSYTTLVPMNDRILLPSYHMPAYDTNAQVLIQEALPGYHIDRIDATYLSARHASLHGMTKEVPQERFLQIFHEKNVGPQIFAEEYTITCLCNAIEEVEAMWLYYRLNSEPTYTKTEIFLVCPQHFGKIEGLTPTDTVHYYLEAITTHDTLCYPLSAPEGNFSFWFDPVGEIAQEAAQDDLLLAPNPSTGTFRLMGYDRDALVQLQLIDSRGSTVYSSQRQLSAPIQLSPCLPDGYYLLRIKSKDRQYSLKLFLNK